MKVAVIGSGGIDLAKLAELKLSEERKHKMEEVDVTIDKTTNELVIRKIEPPYSGRPKLYQAPGKVIREATYNGPPEGAIAKLRSGDSYVVDENGSFRRAEPKPISKKERKKLKAKFRKKGLIK